MRLKRVTQLQTQVFVEHIVFAEHVVLPFREDRHHAVRRTQFASVVNRLLAVAENDGVIDAYIAVKTMVIMLGVLTHNLLVRIRCLVVRLEGIPHVVHYIAMFYFYVSASVGSNDTVVVMLVLAILIVGCIIAYYAVDHLQLGVAYIAFAVGELAIDIHGCALGR